MKTYTATIQGVGQIIFSKFTSPSLKGMEKLEREGNDAYDERIWPQKAHAQNGEVIIPRTMFKRALEDCAKYMGQQIPGKGKSTYTKHFKSGVHVTSDLMTGVNVEDLDCTVILANADGVRGSGKRVMRHFPSLNDWRGEIEITIVDEIVTPAVLKDHLTNAGRLIGIGSFRLEKGNTSGGFEVVKLEQHK